MSLQIGDFAPDFTLPSTSGSTFSLSKDGKDKPYIIYFYPKDFTPGCTKEACSFRDNIEDFRNYDIDVLGISTDTVSQHLAFKEKHKLPFELLADVEGKVSKAYKARMPFMNVSKRITYMIDRQHRIVAVYSNLFGAEKHIQQMIDKVKKEKVAS
jgi:peroxiredoxin Q/BCP